MHGVKILAATAALAFFTTGALAAPLVDAECGNLPNTNWSWSKSTSTTTTFGELNFAGVSGNAFADVTTTTVVSCTAVNPGGNVVEDKSTSVVLGSTTEERVKVCSQQGEDLAGALCTQ